MGRLNTGRPSVFRKSGSDATALLLKTRSVRSVIYADPVPTLGACLRWISVFGNSASLRTQRRNLVNRRKRLGVIRFQAVCDSSNARKDLVPKRELLFRSSPSMLLRWRLHSVTSARSGGGHYCWPPTRAATGRCG